MAVADVLHEAAAVTLATTRGEVVAMTCPLCGATLLIDPSAEVDALVRHAEFHKRHYIAQLQAIREPSEPKFVVGAIVHVPELGRDGKVVDMWTDVGPVHWYTIRLDGCELKDLREAQLAELVVPD